MRWLLRKLAGHSKRIFDALCRKLTEDLEAHLKEKDRAARGEVCHLSLESYRGSRVQGT